MVKQSKKNANNTQVCSYMGNGVGSDWFAENTILVNKISDVKRRGKEKKEVDLPKRCSEIQRL
jgi:hypothetical protein